MRIQNNIMAMNTHRQYTINNDNVAKSAEKLSSGYRINRAGDDAAGLAISEKMRAQVRGLNMATKNSQDAISLVQTAEGALQETHSMLQRMNELADQSATGTNQKIDRAALSKEFEQLKREINDVAEQTTFNNMKILDGSLSYTGLQRSAATAGIVATTTTGVADSSGVKASSIAYAAATKATFTVDLAGMSASGVDATDTFDIAIGAATLTSDVAGGGGGVSLTDVDIAALFDTQTVTIGGKSFTAAVTAGSTKVVLTADTPEANLAPTTDATVDITGNGTVDDQPTDLSLKDVANGTDEVKASVTATVDAKKLSIGDVLKVGDTTYELVRNAGDEAAGRVGIVWDKTSTLTTLVDGINGQAPTGLTVTQTASGFVAEQTAGGNVGKTGLTYTAKAPASSTIEFDPVKLKVDDIISVKVDGTEYQYQFKPTNTMTDIFDGLRAADGTLFKTATGATLKGNAIMLNSAADVSGFIPRTEAPENYNAIRIQVGALEGEQLSLSIESMNTAGLKLDGVTIDTQDDAGKAVTATRTAIDQVSDLRAKLGAMQNRLDHKIANLKVSAENLTAAEARIRDVDIASEMTQFTKSNILAQAATAMLAQANSLPQNVLSLLR